MVADVFADPARDGFPGTTGNRAGVVWLQDSVTFPPDIYMARLAARYGYSETVFVLAGGPATYKLRYFTPVDEVDFCGHATLAAFELLRSLGVLDGFSASALPKAGTVRVEWNGKEIFMEMVPSRTVRFFSSRESLDLYRAFGLEPSLRFTPEIICTGLSDILLAADSKEQLDTLEPHFEMISALSQLYGVVGFHVFYVPEMFRGKIYCRNFAPLYGIPEEAATGTSNASLAFYLFRHGYDVSHCVCIQGESMGKSSLVTVRYNGQSMCVGGLSLIINK